MALRGLVNLSDALQTLGRSHDSAEVAERGMELATRVGLTRSVYGVMVAIKEGLRKHAMHVRTPALRAT